MASNWAALGALPGTTAGFGATGWGGIAAEAPEPDRGFFSTILHETGRDIIGAGKVLGASFFAPFDLLGVTVPLTFDDVTKRDWTGALMTASIAVGGLASKGIQSAVVGARGASQVAKGISAVQRAGITAGSEAAAGAFVGGLRPLDAGESRLESVLQDATLFAGLGGTFSLIGSGVKATVGARIAELKGQTKQALLQQAAMGEQTRIQLREFAGVRLRNPDAGTDKIIRRRADGSVVMTYMGAEGSAEELFSDFNSALAAAFDTGFVENLGIPRSVGSLKATSAMDPEVVRQIQGEAGDAAQLSPKRIVDAIGSIDLAGYKAVRDLASKTTDIDRLHTWLGIEAVTEATNELGEVVLQPATRRNILAALPKATARRLGKIERDSEFLQEAILEGVVSMENIADAMQARSMLKELFMNGQLEGPMSIVAASPYDITFLSKILTPSTIARIHPEVKPFYQLADQAAETQVLGMRRATEWFRQLERTLPTAQLSRVVAILDDVQDAGSVTEATRIAKAAAESTGDPAIIEAMKQVTSKLGEYRLRLVAKGRLGTLADDTLDESVEMEARSVIDDALAEAGGDGEAAENLLRERFSQPDAPLAQAVTSLLDDAGRAGYFPIINIGQYKLDLDGSHHGYYRTREDALKAAAEVGTGRAFITPSTQSIDAGSTRLLPGKEFGKLVQALRAAESYEISAKEAADLLRESGTSPTAGRRKFSRFLQPRRLGIRDFSEDPFSALQFYLSNVERTLAFDTFERQAKALIDNVPDAKPQLKQWMEDQASLMLGRPTQAESLITNALERLFPGSVQPRAVRRWALFMRRAQGWSKLGGAWSGAVNITQMAVNVAPILGTRWAAVGMKAVLNRAEKRRISKFFADEGIDLGLHTGLTHEGNIAGTERIKDEITHAMALGRHGEKKKAVRAVGDALENLWMMPFNGAERFNRLATAWGAYQKGMIEHKMSKEGAIAFAKEMVEKTQFNYRISNIPQLMQGPIGGLLLQFKTYFINEIELIAQADTKTRLKMLFAMHMLGGMGTLLALPGIDLVNEASKLLFDMKLSEALPIGAGQARGEDDLKLAQFAAFGAPGFFDIDMSNYVGPGGFNELLRGIWGPTGSDVKELGKFVVGAMNDLDSQDRVSPTTWNNFAQRVMPAQLRRLERGLEIIGTGEVRNPYSGKLVYQPEKRLPVGLLQILGPPDLETSVHRAYDDYTTRKVRHYREARESFRKQIALALINGDAAASRQLQAEAAATGITFTPQQVRAAVESFSKTADERRRDRTPRDLRDELAPFF